MQKSKAIFYEYKGRKGRISSNSKATYKPLGRKLA